MSPAPPLIFGLGEVLWDLLPQGRQLGGAPANFAYFTAALGAEAYVVSAVGHDALGDEVIERLAAMGLKTSGIARDAEHETGKASVALDEAGVPRFTIHEPAAWDFIPPSNDLPLEDAAAVCFGTLSRRHPVSRESIRQMVRRTAPTALRVLDLNLRAPFYSQELITDCLTLATALKINDSELATLAEIYELAGEELEWLRTLQKRFALPLIALSKGAEGSVLVHGESVSHHPAVATNVVDTIGAGDAFTAALVIGMLDGADLGTVHHRAAMLASFVCSQPGATPRVPSACTARVGAPAGFLSAERNHIAKLTD